MEYKNEQEKYEAEEIKEKWEKLTIPLILLLIFVAAWVLWIGYVISETPTLNGWVLAKAERIGAGLQYTVDGKTYVYPVSPGRMDEIPIGAAVNMYYSEEDPMRVRYSITSGEAKSTFTIIMLGVPLLLLTAGVLYWIYRIFKPKEKHYLGEERPDAEKS